MRDLQSAYNRVVLYILDFFFTEWISGETKVSTFLCDLNINKTVDEK